MIIGIPREIKDHEYRVALTPEGAARLTAEGHRVLVQQQAGAGSGYPDEEYRKRGADLVNKPEEIFASADLIVKVKEPLESEYSLLRPGLVLFTYLHLAGIPGLTEVLLEKRITGIAYETVQLPDGTLPLLTPMSEVAGRLAVQVGAHYLEKAQGGRGVLLAGVPGVLPGMVAVLGAGVVGANAAMVALGLGARVTLMNRDANRLRLLSQVLHGNLQTVVSTPESVAELVRNSDLVIGAVLIPGGKAPKIVTRAMVKSMRPGSVIVDVSVDQGGCFETTRPTSHSDPVYVEEGVTHYCVTNMPGAVPRTSTQALCNSTLPYIVALAGKGAVDAMKEDPSLARGLDTFEGRITHPAVEEARRASDQSRV
jgi:alanine dehydrogenase